MKKLTILVLLLIPLLTACKENLHISINNPLAIDRNNEMVEVNLDLISNLLTPYIEESFIIENKNGEEIPYQITHDQKVIFQVCVKANDRTSFCIHKGTPQKYATKAHGNVYPQRMDDLAWENDLMGFRAYGPTLQKKGERGFGYDLFAKRETDKPVLEGMYANECSTELWAKFTELNKKDPKTAREFFKTFSYHCDQGYGMDCYAVGPTLGAGVAALLNDKDIVYPWCYKTCEILDNGPLRFSARLIFNPIQYKDQQIVETRIITLDAGSHMNCTKVSYKGIKEVTPIVSGIVLHTGSDQFIKDTAKGYIAYQDPTTGPDQGQLFLGHVHPKAVKDTRVVYFNEDEIKARNNARGHILAESTYVPNSEFVYYWGFGWNRSDIPNFENWQTYIETFAEKMKSPLIVSIN